MLIVAGKGWRESESEQTVGKKQTAFGKFIVLRR